MEEQKRIRRTSEQIAADLDGEVKTLKQSIAEIEKKKAASAASFDEKIAAVNGKIEKLLAKKKAVLAPAKKRRPRRSKTTQLKEIIKHAQKSGLKLNEIAEKLGVTKEDV